MRFYFDLQQAVIYYNVDFIFGKPQNEMFS